MAAAQPSEARPSPWLTLPEAAAHARLSVDTLRRAMRAGDLPHSGGGGGHQTILIHAAHLETWLANRGGER